MYTVTAKIPLDFDFETTAKSKKEAVEKFWDKINEMDGKELKEFFMSSLTYDDDGCRQLGLGRSKALCLW